MRHFAKLWQHETSPNIRVNSRDSRAEKISHNATKFVVAVRIPRIGAPKARDQS
jgi:hypothetical protein